MPDIDRESDARLMAAALAIARRGLGRVWPNPAVGCLIVDERGGRPRIVARGWTGEGGRPHAEAVALAHAGQGARGATAYVTLEPCAHHGQTPPCAEALIRAGVVRVVSAIEDPDPRVGGRGHAAIEAAGIALDIGCCADLAAELNRGFISRVRLGRPHVTLKLAVSADGKIAATAGKRTRLTGPEADRRVHMMRARADAIMIGAGTWRSDDPELTCRIAGMERRSPVRVAVDRRLELAPSSRLLATVERAPVWLMAGERHDPARRAALEKAGARVLVCPVETARGLDAAAMLRALGDQGITRLLVEGGRRLAESLLAADLVDEAAIIATPHKIGPGGVAAPDLCAVPERADPPRFVLVSRDRLGADTVRQYRRSR